MKRFIIYIFMLMLVPMTSMAQSMSDAQVAQYIAKEHAMGTSNTQIVTKLIQKGVNIQQIRRVRKQFEKMQNESSLGSNTSQVTNKSHRLRVNNGNTRDDYGKGIKEETYKQSNYRVAPLKDSKYTHTFDNNDEEFGDMQKEMFAMYPDSTQMLTYLLDKQKRDKNRVFGRDIFNNKDLTFEPNMNIATPQNYRLGPGDAVIVEIYGVSQKTLECTVSPEGEITIEGYGPVTVGGLTVAQANARLRNTVGTRYQSSRIKLTVGQTKTMMINVMGEVKAPGTYTLSAFATVFHALYMAGGTNDLGTLRNIKVYRNNKLVTVVDIYDYILNGKLTGNVRLADNDVIVVGPYDCLVTISGKVKRPMIYEMKKNESLNSLLKYAGGFTGDAYMKSVRVNRKTGREYAVFNVEEFDFSSFHIADCDSVSVDSILPRYENTVEVKGAVFRPGMYNIGKDVNSVRSLIEHAEGVTEEAFTTHAVMHRMKKDRSLQVISVDIAGIMNGSVADIPLQENDVLFVPTRKDKINQQTITIRGEVQYPGVYKYAENETIEDFVLQAGGLTDKASEVKVSVNRRVHDSKATSPDSIIAESYSLSLKDGFVIDGKPGFELMPFDEVFVFASPGYTTQQNVTVEGEVMFAGTYTITKREARLTDLLKNAGGVTDLAYIKGARLERKTNSAEHKRMEEVLKMMKEQQQQMLMDLATSTNNSNIATIAEQTKNQMLEKFQVPDYYSVGIELDKAIEKPKSDANIVLREGDRLIIPKYNGTVKVSGAVMYNNTIAYSAGKSAKYYINAAGGFAQNAKKSNAYIIYMNGMVSKLSAGAKVQPGCEIVIPAKINRKKSAAETMGIASSATSMAAMIATIANIMK